MGHVLRPGQQETLGAVPLEAGPRGQASSWLALLSVSSFPRSCPSSEPPRKAMRVCLSHVTLSVDREGGQRTRSGTGPAGQVSGGHTSASYLAVGGRGTCGFCSPFLPAICAVAGGTVPPATAPHVPGHLPSRVLRYLQRWRPSALIPRRTRDSSRLATTQHCAGREEG